MKALGVHVFAGGFTHGVQNAGWDVVAQLEAHDFGLETARANWSIECINDAKCDWPTYSPDDIQMCFANPRCTAFSTVTGGKKYHGKAHGAWAKQTCDAHQTVDYAVFCGYPFIVWESVQGAYTTGKPLLDYFVKERFAPNNYRIAHVFINAATFGNAQQRKRYFMVAYKDCYRFNISPPVLPRCYTTLYDVIGDTRTLVGRQWPFRESGYGADCWQTPSKEDISTIKALPTGWGVNMLAKFGYHLLTERQKMKWDLRESNMPFSLHCLRRVAFLRPAPTMFSACHRWVHPELNRTLTVGELTKVMGWPADKIPIGPNPQAQLCKGVCPEVGEWLARQVQYSLEDKWGNDDWESSFNGKNATWEGQDSAGQLEKVINMTQYAPQDFDAERYENLVGAIPHKFNIDAYGRVITPWKQLGMQNA